jgi:hypothetical protein
MRTAKENGAVAVHIAHSNPASCELWRHFPGTQRTNGFALLRAPTVIACDMLMMSDVPQMFPKLRWGFIEASAQWGRGRHNHGWIRLCFVFPCVTTSYRPPL